MQADIFGSHRVLEPIGVLPQAATRINSDPAIFSNEILIDVIALQPTSTAFNRIRKECNDNIEDIKRTILNLVKRQGKFQDPVTKSGGILIGKVSKIGKDLKLMEDLKEGDKIATLVSLSLTPLNIEKILEVNLDTDQIMIKGTAILFASGIFAKLPQDLPEKLAMAVLDVAGAPAQVRINVKAGDIAVVIGAGKAGILCLQEAMNRVGPQGKVICLEFDEYKCRIIRELGIAHHVIQANAQAPLETLDKYQEIMGDELADFTVNCVNVFDTEVTSVLLTKDTGIVYYFSMNTNFAKASLGAEGVKKYTRMLIGNGYYPGHSDITFEIMRNHPDLRNYFEEKFAREVG